MTADTRQPEVSRLLDHPHLQILDKVQEIKGETVSRACCQDPMGWNLHTCIFYLCNNVNLVLNEKVDSCKCAKRFDLWASKTHSAVSNSAFSD